MRYRIFPYKAGSQSAKALAGAVGGLTLKRENTRYVPHARDMIINWGATEIPPELIVAGVLNDPDQVAVVTNKLTFFQKMKAEAPELIPVFWTERNQIPSNAYPVVCRKILNGHSGAGIVIANNASELVPAPLYVKYVKKTDEYRVHVGKQLQIISIQRKARSRDVPDEDVNWQIRNHKNGFVFVRQDVTAPPLVTLAALRTLGVTGLDFGAVDVIHHRSAGNNTATVLEINTAPGLAGTTVDEYARYFQSKAR